MEKLPGAVAKRTCARENVPQLWSAPSTFRRSDDHFGSSDVEKLHAAVAKCTFESQNVKKL